MTFVLTAILALAVKMNSPVFAMALLFLPVSFLASLSIGAQSFTLMRLPFIFLNGIVFFLFLFRDNLSDAQAVSFGAIVFYLIFLAMGHFTFLYKALPNIASDEYENFALKYALRRDVVFVFLFLAAFAWYIDAFVLYSIFSYPFYSVLLIIFFITFLLTLFAVRIYAAPGKENKNSRLPAIYIWAISLIIIQASWIIGFWPFGYLTAALIIIIIYYITLSVVKEYFFGKMTPAKMVKEFLFGLLIVAMVFYFTRWLPA